MKGAGNIKIKIYGSRGSMPFFCRNNLKYGGNTSCVKLEAGERTIILDCGSGLMQFMGEAKQPLSLDILISHLHIDHTIGLSMFAPLWNNQNDIRVYTKSRESRPLAEQVFGLFHPPCWPVDLNVMSSAEIIEVEENKQFNLSENIKVTPFAGQHPDNTLAFKIDAQDKSVVYMLDYEIGLNAEKDAALERYCKGASLIIFDSAYMPEDYPGKKGFGHSDYGKGLELAGKSGCEYMLFTHFDHKYSDGQLDALAEKLAGINKNYLLAYDGMEVTI